MPRTFPTAALATGLALLAGAAPAQAAPRTRLAGTLPTYARTTRALGAATGTAPVRALIALRHRDQAGLDAFITAVSDPSSPSYRHYLSPAAFEARFAPTEATVSRVEAFARASGLTVTSVPRNRAYVAVRGTVTDAEQAFATTISRYSATIQAPSTALSVPAALKGAVLDVSGLDTGDIAHAMASPPPAYVNTGPCSTAWADTPATGTPSVYGGVQPAVPCGYTPQQVQGAYGLTAAHAAGLDGTGQRVAIIDAYSSPAIVADATTYSAKHGLPAPKIELHDTALQRNAVEGPTVPSLPIVGDLPVTGLNVQDPQGWAGEETLDVEAVHTSAPGATIVYQGADSAMNMDLQTAQNNVVSGKLAQIVSNSYGGSTDDADATSDAIWQQAAAQGMGVYFSSGDAGDETAGGTAVASRATDAGGNSPWVTSVGGTTLAVDKSTGYQFETYWGTFSSTLTNGAWSPAAPGTFNSGGGGGTSQAYAQPDYQKGVVDPKFSQYWATKTTAEGKVSGSAPVGRVTPDVAMLADPNSGFLMGLSQDYTQFGNLASLPLPGDDTHYGEYRIGGTSLSSPLFAGVMALADQAAGAPHGFANPALYAARGASAFHDVTAPASTVAVVRTNYTNSTNAAGGTTTLLRTAGQTGTLTSQPGYDDSTGLGSPQGLGFLAALAPGSALVAKAQAGAAPAATPVATTTTTPGPAGAPKTCTPPATLRYTLHAKGGQRVVKVTLSVGGKRLVSRSGHKLTRVTIKRPKGTRFTVAVTSQTNRGSITKSTRTYTQSGCAKTDPTVRHSTLKRKKVR